MPAFVLLFVEMFPKATASIVMGVAISCFGALRSFYLGVKNLWAARVAARTTESPIRSLAPGMVKIFGKVEGEEPLTSPMTGVPCYYFAASSEKLGERDWSHLQRADERRKFYVNDGTSRISSTRKAQTST